VQSDAKNVAALLLAVIFLIIGIFLIFAGLFTQAINWDGVNGGGFSYLITWPFMIPGIISIIAAIALAILVFKPTDEKGGH
jgi:hypothetical protein